MSSDDEPVSPFNIKLLNFIGKVYQSYIYGSFMTNNIKEGHEIGLEGKTVSVWSDVLEERDRYCNVFLPKRWTGGAVSGCERDGLHHLEGALLGGEVFVHEAE